MIDRASSAGKRGGREPAEDMSERSVQPCSALAEAAAIRWKVLMPLSFSDVSLLLCGQQAAALEEGLRAQVTGELSKHQRGWAWQHCGLLLGGLQEGKGKSSACKLYTVDLETEGLELYDLHYCMYLPGNVYKIRRFDLFSRTLRTASLELKCAR